MEPPRGILASLWNFICFLPYFIGLLLLGFIKGLPFRLFCSKELRYHFVPVDMPYYDHWKLCNNIGAKQIGPVLKVVLCLLIPAPLILWPLIGIVGSIVGGAAYGLLAPMFATFEAVGEGKTNEFFHCIYDGTVDTVKGSFTIVRDFGDVCYHSYFSIMKEMRLKAPSEGKYYEIRLLYLPVAVIIGVLGSMVDFLIISIIALLKSPYMLFKGWHRLFHDCIGREGPFLETICVPFAGLAILLWPLAVVGAVLGSMISNHRSRIARIGVGRWSARFAWLGSGRAGLESSFWSGLCYIVASLSIYDEYSNDILDMPEGSCFPRPRYRKKAGTSRTSSRASSFTRPDSFRNPPTRSGSLKGPMVELRPLELLDSLFEECQRHGERMVSEGLITLKDIEDAKSNKGSGRVISTGLPAYCLLQALLRSAKANSTGILLADNETEITSTNRPKDTFFEWFLNPLLIIKDQIKTQNLSESEEEYLGQLVLLNGDPERLKNSNIGSPPESELKQAELDALARRLQGITKSISRYPTYRRRFDTSIKMISEELAKKNGSTKPGTVSRSRSTFARIFSQNSFKRKTSSHGTDEESQRVAERDVEIE
ncbi:hypothetical protein LguiB_011414 [Lonicera macranthoides]